MLDELVQAIIASDPGGAENHTRAALAAGIAPRRIISEGLIAGMDVVGRRFRDGEMFVPQVLMSARAMHRALNLVKPLVTAGEAVSAGKVIIGTVKGDLHDIGKNLVAMLLEGAGFEVVNLGVDISPETFVAAARREGAELVAMSALLTTTMLQMRQVVRALEEAGLRQRVRVIVGGAPVTTEFANEIGADGYGLDAAEAVELSRSLVAANRIDVR